MIEQGYYCPRSGMHNYSTCTPGTFSKSNAIACSECGIGQISSGAASTCTSCQVGRFATDDPDDDEGGQKKQVVSKATHCNKCPGGYHSPSKSTLVCQACGAGSSSNPGARNCTLCIPGRWSASGDSNCTFCSPGRFSNAGGSSSCAACGAGTVVNIWGALSCTLCPLGQFQGSTGQSECEYCQPGTYNDGKIGFSTCADCSGNRFSTAGSAHCHLCLREYFYTLDGNCRKCPDPGTECATDGNATQETLTLLPGYWRIAQDSVNIYECPFGSAACIGGGTFADRGDSYCQPGYKGMKAV